MNIFVALITNLTAKTNPEEATNSTAMESVPTTPMVPEEATDSTGMESDAAAPSSTDPEEATDPVVNSASTSNSNVTTPFPRDSTARDDEEWREMFLPFTIHHDGPAIAATIYDYVRICGAPLLRWAFSVFHKIKPWESPTNGAWDASIQATLRVATDEPSILGRIAATEWTTVELDLLEMIKSDCRNPAERLRSEKTMMEHRLEMLLILHFFRVLFLEWFNGRVIRQSMASTKQSLSRTDAAALRVPLVARQRFLEAFATRDTTTGDYVMTDSDTMRCNLHMLILYLNIHQQFDVDRDELSPGPLTADFTRFVASLELDVVFAMILLEMAGCVIKYEPKRGTVKATLSYPPTYPTVAELKELGNSIHIDWGATDTNTTTAATPHQSPSPVAVQAATQANSEVPTATMASQSDAGGVSESSTGGGSGVCSSNEIGFGASDGPTAAIPNENGSDFLDLGNDHDDQEDQDGEGDQGATAANHSSEPSGAVTETTDTEQEGATTNGQKTSAKTIDSWAAAWAAAWKGAAVPFCSCHESGTTTLTAELECAPW